MASISRRAEIQALGDTATLGIQQVELAGALDSLGDDTRPRLRTARSAHPSSSQNGMLAPSNTPRLAVRRITAGQQTLWRSRPRSFPSERNLGSADWGRIGRARLTKRSSNRRRRDPRPWRRRAHWHALRWRSAGPEAPRRGFRVMRNGSVPKRSRRRDRRRGADRAVPRGRARLDRRRSMPAWLPGGTRTSLPSSHGRPDLKRAVPA
jgi:hypothetical protein